MKNIHVLPTDKPSRLFMDDKTTNIYLSLENNLFKNGLNIYITSDEEIKEGDWFYQGFDSIIHKCYKLTDNYVIADKPSDYPKKICKKIILTTDQELIKDGVQAIDDEFLKNGLNNLKRNKIMKTNKKARVYNSPIVDSILSNIPKEEPKQETLEEAKNKAWDNYEYVEGNLYSTSFKNGFEQGAKSDAAKEYWFNKFQEQDKNKFSALETAISLLKQTTEFEVLDSWKQKIRELEQIKNK